MTRGTTWLWDAFWFGTDGDAAWDPADPAPTWLLVGPPSFDAARFARRPLIDQPWYPAVNGDPDTQALDQKTGPVDRAVVFGTRDKIDMLGRVARGATALTPSGLMAVVIDNADGARSVLMTLGKTGFRHVVHSKHHARLALGVWDASGGDNVRADWIDAASMHKRASDDLWVQAGLHGAREADRGSCLLRSCLPDDVAGDLADLGCGYGLLTHDAARRFKNLKSITGYDADRRALKCFERNMDSSILFSIEWCDLAQPLDPGQHNRFDTIVMNPPFHEGRHADPVLGKMFIRNAARMLRKKGRLWMVANRFLPYEDTLAENFSTFRQIADSHGFKVIEAVR